MAKIKVRPAARSQPLVHVEVVAPAKSREKGSRRYSRLNDVTGRFLVGLVLISAIPVASNRPAWWLIWTLLLGVSACLYVLRAHILMRGRRRFQTSKFRVFFGLAILVPLYAGIQFMPWAAHIPAGFQALPSLPPDVMRPDSLSVMPAASLLGAIRAVGFLVFLILVIEVGANAHRTHRLGFWVMIGILCHGLFGLVALRLLDDYAIWGVKELYQGALTGTFVNRNSIATFLGFGLVIGVAYAVTQGQEASQTEQDRGYTTFLSARRLEILGLWFVTALLALCVLLTQSRMGVLATTFGAFVTFFVLRLKFNTSPKRSVLEAAAVLLILLAGLIPFAGSGVGERFLFTLVDSSDRVSVYLQTWGMIQNRPLSGFGYDAFAPAFELYRADPLVAVRYVDLAHNTYLTLWAEQGFLIGSIPMILIGWAAVIIIQRLRTDQGDIAMNAAALGVIALGASHSLVDFSLEIPANVYCFLLIVGLAIAPARLASGAATDRKGLDVGDATARSGQTRGAA